MVQNASLLLDQRCPRGWLDEVKENKISQRVTGTLYRRGADGESSTNIRDIETSPDCQPTASVAWYQERWMIGPANPIPRIVSLYPPLRSCYSDWLFFE
jgi:hypothetical protein